MKLNFNFNYKKITINSQWDILKAFDSKVRTVMKISVYPNSTFSNYFVL